eukprot:2274836-Prymnesium_polylepis.1
MSGAHAAACAEHRATHSSASGRAAAQERKFLRCIEGGVRSPFTLGTQHVARGPVTARARDCSGSAILR